MPSRLKKKKADLKFDATSGEIQEEAAQEAINKSAPVRQVVEVVGDDLPDALETIKKDAQEIEKEVEKIEETQGENAASAEVEPVSQNNSRHKTVESLFNDDTSVASAQITAATKPRKSLGVWVGAMLGMALAIGLSLIFFVRGPSVLPFSAGQVPTETPTETPTPSPTTAALNRKDITVRVLNGGGVAGAAGKMQELLEDLGYTVDSVGNASSYDYEETEISVKAGKEDVASLLTRDLQEDYLLASESGTLDETESFDAQVIIGKE
jgi:hypothetical protein